MKKNRWKKGIALFLSITAIFTGSMIPTQASEYWPQAPETASPCVMVMEMNTGAVLYEKNADEVHYPASITKIMTTLIAIEKGKMDDVVTFSADAVYKNEGDTSHISRDLEEQMTLEQCLYGVMLESANECAYAVAEHIGGGDVSKFVDMMNEKAKELGCTNTHFNNTNGLPDEQHYTSTRDMLLIARAAYENEEFRKITGTKVYVIPPTNKHEDETTLHNHHNMLYPFRTAKYIYDGCTGGKTGYTVAANSTLVTYAERDGMSLVCVVMNAQAPAHFEDTVNLFNYCFDNFQLFNIAENETNYTSAEQKNAGTLNTNEPFVDIDKDAGIVLPKTAEFSDATSKIVYDDVTNDTVGTIEYTYAGHEVGKADIVKTNVQVPEYKFSNQTDVSEEAQTEETEHVSKIQIRMSTIITVVVVVLVLLVLGIIIKKVADNFYIIKHNFEVRKEHKRLFKREKKRNKRRRRRR